MASASAVPLLLLCAVRPTREHRSRHVATLATHAGPDCSITLRLHDLSPAESRHLLAALVPAAALPAALTEEILTRAQGNPFFLEELVRALLDAGDLAHDGTTWRAREAHTLATVPVSVQSVILSRVDRLPAAAQHVLHTAAVIGRLFRRRLLVAVLHSVAALDGALTDLEEGEFIYLERAFPDEEYSFQHVLVQETVYHTLARRRRAELHGEVAAALERLHGPDLEEYYEQLAYQYDQAGRADKAVPYLLRAGEKARRAYHTAEAETFFQRALARLDTVAEGETEQQWRLAALTGLGQVSFVTGKMAEAEGLLRQAIALGRELELGARDLVHLYYWLAEVLFWQGRRRERIALGKDGLALLGDETASVEAALMNATIGWGHVGLGEIPMARAAAARLGAFIRGVPYVEELLPTYLLLITIGLREKNVGEALHWAETFARLGEQHHDLRALANVEQLGFAALREATGDLRAALTHHERACELYSQIGNPTNEAGNLEAMGRTFLALGDLQRAEERTRQAILVAKRADRTWLLGDGILLLGSVALARGAWEAARRHIDDARRLYDRNHPTDLVWPAVYLGQIHLALGERTAALHDFETAFLGCQLDESMRAWDFLVVPQALRGLEEAGARADRVRALVQRRRREHPRASTLPQTPCLERATGGAVPGPLHNQGALSWATAWTWHDPCGDCSHTVQEHGIVVRAANGRTLWHVNLSAPCLLQPAPAGEWAVQAVCGPVSAEHPASGGLLLWQNERNYLVLERGHWGAGDIAFRGCLAGEDCYLGRGYLPGARVWLRLQRQGTQVRALCSADGEHWFSAGSVGFSRAEGEQVGLHAIGSIDRTIYHGAYPEGTAMHFTSVEVGGTDAT
jgi:tetratricopeptide (TPR) repeat protein